MANGFCLSEILSMADIDVDKCRITHYPAEVLIRRAQSVEKIDDNIRRLVDKMADIMLSNKGIGLAGPQAGVNLQIFIISLDGTREGLRVYINPKVFGHGEFEAVEEGCLSVPAIYAKIRRYKHCTVTATNLEGEEFTEEADGLYARCLQHEYDHLEGMTIADRMSSTEKIAHKRQLKRLAKQQKTRNSH